MKYSIENKYGHCSYCICEDCSMIYNLHIFKEYRRKGHAKNMLQQAIEEIREHKYVGDIRISANSDEDIDREILVKLYDSFGLKVV